MSSRVDVEIARANEFCDRIEDFVIAKGKCPTGDRNTLLIGYWSLIFEIHRGVLCLSSNKLFGSAFALVRPIVEAATRAHVVIICSEKDLLRLQNDEYRTNFNSVGREIDAAFDTDDFFEGFLRRAKNALHSYTHAGTHQLGRRFSGNDLLPNYSDDEIIEVVRASTCAVFMVNNLLTKHFGFEEEWEQSNTLFQEWGTHP